MTSPPEQFAMAIRPTVSPAAEPDGSVSAANTRMMVSLKLPDGHMLLEPGGAVRMAWCLVRVAVVVKLGRPFVGRRT